MAVNQPYDIIAANQYRNQYPLLYPIPGTLLLVLGNIGHHQAGYNFSSHRSLSDSDAATDSYWLDHGHICSLLDREEFARILLEFKPVDRLYQLPSSEAPQFRLAAGRGQSLASILQHYHLTPRDRVSLSYSVARTYWQFYDSELMRRKWSSESIWFMPTSSDDHKDELPLQAFVSFPFESPNHRIEDFIDDLKVPLNHRCPRVFALGVLLLEIGCGSPFTTPVHQNLSSQANFDHSTANNLLQKLRNSKWDGFSHMNYFVGAVEYCLDGKNFIQDSPDSTRRRSQPLKKQQDISERRKNLYNRVVRPLGWLAVKGFKTRSSGTAYIRKIRNAAVTTAQGLPARPKAFVRPKMGKFHNGSTASNNWIQSLVRISAYIDDRRVQLDLTSPIRVAILDTGINYNMPYYEDEEYADNRINQVESFCDFLEPAARDGGVIFLASAGNSSDEAEAFPARDPKVISIYATNRHGTFLEFNSQPTHDRTRILGTYGDGIPPEITAEFDREYRGVCQPGSSVATAVAAGTAALMLAYIATFPKVFASSANRKTLQRAHDSRGMEALFRKMGQQSPTGGLFINPGHFWRVNNTDEARFHAISSCLWDVDRYM
ncbi:hypothetical protein CEP52_011857 [Fusarium oligoseptatum]|uniref:Uncharacterized protein n=1 Tax=Fusarium oligoseptatum TaxID=2604345 RepID=A0A428T199_9HYPO|nr:hypothetical protein CEP52_011857 [Fusarium oligoseptatum]